MPSVAADVDLGGNGGRVTLDDLRRLGPALILSDQDSNDGRVLVWTD